MTLANIFYVMAIILMSLIFILMVALVVAVFYIKNKINEIQLQIEEKINAVMRPAETVMDIGTSIASTAARVIGNFSKKRPGRK